MRSRFLYVSLAVLVAGTYGCTSAPKLDENAEKQVIASTPKADGNIRYFTVTKWFPNSREINFAPSKVGPSLIGIAVVTDKSFLFQQWGGPSGLTVIKRIDLKDIENVKIISFFPVKRLLIETRDKYYDSFGASDSSGEAQISEETEKMHKALLEVIEKR